MLTAQKPKDYDAVSADFPAAERHFGVFEDRAWLEASRKFVTKLREDAAKGELVPEPYLVPLGEIAARVYPGKGDVRIVDLGGGIGPCIDPILCVLPDRSAAHYTVVDGPTNAAVGRSLFPEPNIRSATTIPAETFEIAVMSSALQYIHDWRGALDALRATQPAYICISRLPIIEGPTRAVRQLVPLDRAYPRWHWLFAADDLDRHLGSYRVIVDEPIRSLTDELKGAAENIEPCDLRVRCYSLV